MRWRLGRVWLCVWLCWVLELFDFVLWWMVGERFVKLVCGVGFLVFWLWYMYVWVGFVVMFVVFNRFCFLRVVVLVMLFVFFVVFFLLFFMMCWGCVDIDGLVVYESLLVVDIDIVYLWSVFLYGCWFCIERCLNVKLVVECVELVWKFGLYCLIVLFVIVFEVGVIICLDSWFNVLSFL